ncbi:uncharacterized protein LOC143470834 [Clavelina lepadiformis]|uniref:uncharacterized protein LOC143470834 n=1 Tax=Clavelina lepadiformis TaxID=159417 RepID=UPI00404136BD
MVNIMAEEDDDLQALRLAALASIGKKKTASKDTEDLNALRQKALTSRKKQEPDLFEKLQPAKSSNLINLTPGPCEEHQSTGNSTGSKQSSNDGKSSSENELSSDESASLDEESNFSSDEGSDSSSDDESSDESDQGKKESKPVESKPEVKPTDEDDILNAIDQFLDEGVMILDESLPAIEPSKPKETKIEAAALLKEKPDKKKKDKMKKQKKEKAASGKVTEKNVKVSKRTKSKNKRKDTDKKNSEVQKPAITVKAQTEVEHSETEQTQKSKSTEKQSRRPETNLDRHNRTSIAATRKPKDEERPSKRQKYEGQESDSVHSSDLSFLSDSSEEESRTKDKRSEEEVPDKPKSSTITDLSKGKKRDLKARLSVKERINLSGKKPQSKNLALEKTDSDEQSYSDLREKLKGRGLPRRERNSQTNATTDVREIKEVNPIAAKVAVMKTKKIYVKPDVLLSKNKFASNVSQESGLSERHFNDDQISRSNISRKALLPIAVRVDNSKPVPSRRFRIDEKDSSAAFSFRRKRSVIQFAPETSALEKRQKLEALQAQAQEERSFSDLSDQDFDDYEIEEPNEMFSIDTENPAEDKMVDITSTRRPSVKYSRVATALKSEKTESEEECKKEETETSSDEENVVIKYSDPKLTSKRIPKDARDKQVKASAKRTKNESKRDLLQSRRIGITSQIFTSRRNDFNEENEGRTSVRKIGGKAKRLISTKKRADAEEPDWNRTSAKSVKNRLNRNQDPEDSSFGVEEKRRSSSRRKVDREKMLDDRIRKMKEQNAKILQRRQMIEMEEKKFRMKATPS